MCKFDAACKLARNAPLFPPRAPSQPVAVPSSDLPAVRCHHLFSLFLNGVQYLLLAVYVSVVFEVTRVLTSFLHSSNTSAQHWRNFRHIRLTWQPQPRVYAHKRMGFFSSRKTEDSGYQVAIGVTTPAGASGTKEDKSVVRVIRSRFVSISKFIVLSTSTSIQSNSAFGLS